MHRPRFSDSTVHGDSPGVDPLWDAFAANGGDVVRAGHDHTYQRFPPIQGVRLFVVGTGGEPPLYDVVPKRVRAYDDTHRGVLRLALKEGWYTWRFRRVGAAGGDRGSRKTAETDGSSLWFVVRFVLLELGLVAD